MKYQKREMSGGRRCPECGAELIPTSAMWLCCPNGHGKLVARDADEKEMREEEREFKNRLDAVLPKGVK